MTYKIEWFSRILLSLTWIIATTDQTVRAITMTAAGRSLARQSLRTVVKCTRVMPTRICENNVSIIMTPTCVATLARFVAGHLYFLSFVTLSRFKGAMGNGPSDAYHRLSGSVVGFDCFSLRHLSLIVPLLILQGGGKNCEIRSQF